jgi:Aspartyl/Asparaginyl beta-hydroxylase
VQNFYGDQGIRYLRRLAFFQALCFFLVLCLAIVWIAYQVGQTPGSPWVIYVMGFLLTLVLAGWVFQLLYAIPDWYSTWQRRTQLLVLLVTAGAAASSLLVFSLPFRGTWYLELLEFSPLVLAALAACAASSVYVYRLLTDRRIIKVGYEAAQEKLEELRKLSGAEAVARIELSHALEFGSAAGNPLPGPRGYIIAGLTSRPWHDPSAFEWVRRLEESYGEIREELEEILADNSPLTPYDYLGQAGGWNSFRFVQDRAAVEENCRRLPKTAALLKSIPHFPHFRDAMFSILKPGTILPPHRDGTNIYLTCHLGLKIPRGCGIRVGGQTRGWDEGKCIVFDSSYEHEAWNPSDEHRIVLLIDFLHPELTDVEVDWVVAREIAYCAQGV